MDVTKEHARVILPSVLQVVITKSATITITYHNKCTKNITTQNGINKILIVTASQVTGFFLYVENYIHELLDFCFERLLDYCTDLTNDIT